MLIGKNEIIEDHGSWLIVDVSTNAHPRACMSIDKGDYNNIISMGYGRIFAICCNSKGCLYAQTYKKTSVGKYIRPLIHRLISPESKIIDHIDHNGLNNRSSNLRPCSHSQNLMNSRKLTQGTSKYKGVCALKGRNKFIARISVDGESKYLGLFDDDKEAGEAYHQASLKYYGDFACVTNM
jgi:hypothetical protein